LEIKLTLKSNNKTLEIGNDTSYKLVNIDGIDSGSLELNTVSNAQFDGSVVVSKRIQNRPISITVDYKGTNSQEVERQSLISFFNPKNKGLLIVNYGDIERAIEYEVEGFNCKLNSIFDTVSFTVDFLCPQPYWRDILESKINIAMWRGMFHFPLIMPSTVIPHTNPDSTWKDLSGNLNNGLLNGFNFDATSGWTTEGLKFDSDSYVSLPTLDLQQGTIQVNNQVVTFDKNTDYRTTSANSNIVSLNTTVDGVMDIELGGSTLQNIIKNGNFSNGMTNWSTASSTASVSNNTLSITGSGADNTPRANYDGVKLYSLNHKYYIKASARVITDSCRRLIHRTFGASPTDTTIEYPVQNTWYTMSNVFTVASEPTSVQYFGHSYVDATTAVGKVMELKEVIAIDLTAMFGVGNEPTKEWCDANINYFNGIRSVGESENLEVVSCGKNLFDKNKTPNYVYTSTTYNILGNGIKVKNTEGLPYAFIRYDLQLKPNTTYSTSWYHTRFKGTTSRFRIMDKNLIVNYVSSSNIGNTTGSFTTDNTGLVAILLYSCYAISEIGEADFTDFQLEEGTTVTTYEPYKEHRQTIALTNPLRGLPNNVRDIAKGNVATRNVGKAVFNGGVNENWIIDGSNDLYLRIKLNDNKPTLLTNGYSTGFCVCDKFKTTNFVDVYNMVGNHLYIRTNVQGFILSILKSSLATPDVAGFKAWLQANPVTVYYQLAIPTTENLAQTLKLKSFANGTLQVNTLIAPYLSAYYPISLGGSLASNVSRIDLSNPLITTGIVKNYRVYNKILTTEEIARANTTNYLRGPSLLVDLNSTYKELSKTGIIMGLREPSLIVNALNTGNVESGMIIEFKALGTLTNPSILNVETQEFFKVNKSMVAGEIITVNTNVGAKKVIDNLNGVETNILNLIDLDSTFLQLGVGDNLLRYDADTNLDNLEVNIYYNPFYLGV